MKKLLTILSSLVLTSSASTAVVNISEGAATNNGDASINANNPMNKGWSGDHLTSHGKTKNLELLYDDTKTNFIVDKDNNIVNGEISLQFNFNWAGSKWSLISFKSLNFQNNSNNDTNNLKKFFNINLDSYSGVKGYQRYTVTLNKDMVEDMPKLDKDVDLKLDVTFTDIVGLNKRDEIFDLKLHVKKESQPKIIKEQLNDYLGSEILDIGELDGINKTVQDVNKIKEGIQKKIIEIDPSLTAKRWYFDTEIKPYSDRVIIKMDDTDPELGGSVVIKYELAAPKKTFPTGDMNIGEVTTLNKYELSKQNVYLNYSEIFKTFDAWYKKAYANDYSDYIKYISPVGTPIITPSSNKMKMQLLTPYADLNGTATMVYTTPYAKLQDIVKGDIEQTISGVGSNSSASEINSAVRAAIEKQYPDFAGEWDIETPANKNGEYSTTNEVTIVMKDLQNDDKQVIEANDHVTIKYSLDQTMLGSIIKNDSIPAAKIPDAKFMGDKDTIINEIMDYINSEYPSIAGKVEITQDSIDKIDPANPDTWKVTLAPKDGTTSIGGSKEIGFTLNKTDIKDIIKLDNISINDKFLIAQKDQVIESLNKAISDKNESLKDSISIDSKSFKFDATDPSTWKFNVTSSSEYISGNAEGTFKLSTVDIKQDIFKQDITLSKSLSALATTATKEQIKDELTNLVLGNNKSRWHKVGSDLSAHPELKGMVTIELNDTPDQVLGGATIKVDSNYVNHDYLTGEVGINYSLSRVDINSIISAKEINAIFANQSVTENDIKTVNDKIKQYITDKNTILKDSDYEIIASYADDDSGVLSIDIKVTNENSAYVGDVITSVKLETAISLDKLFNSESIANESIDFIQAIKLNNDKYEAENTIEKSYYGTVITEAAKAKGVTLTQNDFEIKDMSIDPNDFSKGMTIKVVANESTHVLKGDIDLHVNIKANSINDEGILSKNNLENLTTSLFVSESDVEKAAMDMITTTTPIMSDYVTVSAKRSSDSSKWNIEIKAKDENVASVLTDTYTFGESLIKINLSELFMGTDNSENGILIFNSASQLVHRNDSKSDLDKNIKNMISTKLQNQFYNEMHTVLPGMNSSFWDSLTINFKGWSDKGKTSTGTATITVNKEFSRFIKGNLTVTFSTPKGDVGIRGTLDGKTIDLSNSKYLTNLTFADWMNNAGSYNQKWMKEAIENGVEGYIKDEYSQFMDQDKWWRDFNTWFDNNDNKKLYEEWMKGNKNQVKVQVGYGVHHNIWELGKVDGLESKEGYVTVKLPRADWNKDIIKGEKVYWFNDKAPDENASLSVVKRAMEDAVYHKWLAQDNSVANTVRSNLFLGQNTFKDIKYDKTLKTWTATIYVTNNQSTYFKGEAKIIFGK